MQCERLLNLTKTWFLSVKDETMAPARMISFMEEHAAGCAVCREDPDLKAEIAKITDLVLPESKIPKAVRQQQQEEEEPVPADAEESEEVDDDEVDDDEDTDDEDPEIDDE